MANDDVKLFRPEDAALVQVEAGDLPIRAVKRISTYSVDKSYFPNNAPEVSDFSLKAAKKCYTEYVLLRLPHRGKTKKDPAYFRFLVNPSQVSVSRTTMEGQVLTRGGWQIGLQGEDLLNISISGQTPGQYFDYGLSDDTQAFSLSYRNLMQLQTFFENNGYWFEGEEAGTGDHTRRRIKMHQDVELWVGNFIWFGMFENMSIKKDSQTPYLTGFELTFTAWKEHYRPGSPYWDPIVNNVQRGHSYGVYENYGNTNAEVLTQHLQASGVLNPPPFPSDILSPGNPPLPTCPAIEAEKNTLVLPLEPTDAKDYSPLGEAFNPPKFI